MKFNKIALIAASALAMAAATSASATVTISGAGKFDVATGTTAISSSLGAFIYSFDVVDASSTTVSNWTFNLGGTPKAAPISVAFTANSFTLTFTGGTTLKFGGVAGLLPFSDGFGAFAQSLEVNGVNHLFATSGSRGTNVRLDVSAVPEPATWALMLGGFGLAGFALRSRSKARVSYAA